jgi:hypothetical protein
MKTSNYRLSSLLAFVGNQKRAVWGIEAFAALIILCSFYLMILPSAAESPYIDRFQRLAPFIQALLILSVLSFVVLALFYILHLREDVRIEEWTRPIAVALLLLIGGALRVFKLLLVNPRLPVHEAGLFVEFAQQIIDNHFFLPHSIPYYTEGGIPFGYPPLSFYVEAVLLRTFPQSEFLIANLLPVVASILTLISIIPLTRALGLGPFPGFITLAIFAIIPSAYSEQSESAGLAEAFGSLAIVWFCTSLAKVYHEEKIERYILAGVALAFCVLTAPGSAYASVFLFVIFSIYQLIRKRANRIIVLGHLILAGITGLLVSSPYWLAVLYNHGIQIYVNTLFTQYQNGDSLPILYRIASLFDFNISGTLYPFFWSFIIFSGFIGAIFRGQWWLPIWFLAFYFIPREGGWLCAIPASLLASYGITEIWTPIAASATKKISWLQKVAILACLGIMILAYIFTTTVTTIVGPIAANYRQADWSQRLEAMQWVKANTPLEGRFIVHGTSELSEWSAHLMRRVVLNVEQGSEWDPQKSKMIKDFNHQINDCLDAACIRQNLKEITSEPQVYLILEKKGMGNLPNQMKLKQDGFEVLWENRTVLVGRFLPSGLP